MKYFITSLLLLMSLGVWMSIPPEADGLWIFLLKVFLMGTFLTCLDLKIKYAVVDNRTRSMIK